MDNLSSGDTVALVIDVQNDFCHPQGAVGSKAGREMDFNRIIEAIAKTLNSLREKAVDVIFVRTIHSAWTDSSGWAARKSNSKGPAICRQGSWGAELCGLNPLPDDLIITKNRYSAFLGTNLDMVLRSRGKQNLLLMGFMANVCVESTARDGFQLNYKVIALGECIGAASQGEHNAAMANIDKYFGQVCSVENLFSALTHL